MEYESDGDDTNCNWNAWNNIQMDWMIKKSGEKWRPSWLYHCYDGPEYWEKSSKFE